MLEEDSYFIPTAFLATPLSLATGLNAVELVYFEGAGEATLEFFTQDANGPRLLVGDLANRGLATATAVPTPTLLPGLIGLGLAALRKRQQSQT